MNFDLEITPFDPNTIANAFERCAKSIRAMELNRNEPIINQLDGRRCLFFADLIDNCLKLLDGSNSYMAFIGSVNGSIRRHFISSMDSPENIYAMACRLKDLSRSAFDIARDYDHDIDRRNKALAFRTVEEVQKSEDGYKDDTGLN